MIPTGRERDKRIAELLGYDTTNIYRDSRGWAIQESQIEKKSQKQIESYGWIDDVGYRKMGSNYWRVIKHYSTNRNDAWELWDLMPAFRELNNVVLPSRGNSFTCSINGIYHCGKDEADAISGAFIKWKESQKEVK